MKITSASNGFAQGTYLGMPWTARRIDNAWKFTTKKKLKPGAKANLATQINKRIAGE